MKLLDLKGFANFLMERPGTVSDINPSHGLPHATPHKAYVFLADDLIDYIKSHHSIVKPKKCHYTKVVKSDTTLYRSMDRELENLHTPRTKRKPKPSMILVV